MRQLRAFPLRRSCGLKSTTDMFLGQPSLRFNVKVCHLNVKITHSSFHFHCKFTTWERNKTKRRWVNFYKLTSAVVEHHYHSCWLLISYLTDSDSLSALGLVSTTVCGKSSYLVNALLCSPANCAWTRNLQCLFLFFYLEMAIRKNQNSTFEARKPTVKWNLL